MFRDRWTLVMIPGLVLYAACSGHDAREAAAAEARTSGDEEVTTPAQAPRAAAEFEAAPDVSLQGHAEFAPTNEGVIARVTISDATPGPHGIHVHERGDCSDIPGKSMGEHFTPQPRNHGLPQAAEHHLGDLGNIDVTDSGDGALEILVEGAALDEGPSSLVGKALVIHEKEDVGTGPSGESGQPIACVVIERD